MIGDILKELSIRAKAVRAIVRSKAFVLITDTESLALAELDLLTKVQAIAVMKHLMSEMKRVSKELFAKKGKATPKAKVK